MKTNSHRYFRGKEIRTSRVSRRTEEEANVEGSSSAFRSRRRRLHRALGGVKFHGVIGWRRTIRNGKRVEAKDDGEESGREGYLKAGKGWKGRLAKVA